MAAFTQRVTTTDALNGQPTPLERAVFFDGFHGVGGTAGGKPAMVAQEGAEQQLVGPDQQLQEL